MLYVYAEYNLYFRHYIQDIKLFEEQEAERRAQAMARNHSQDHTPPPRGSGGSKDTNSTTIKNALLENSY